MRIITYLGILLFFFESHAQQESIFYGKVFADTPINGAVHIWNRESQEGTITDKNFNFKMEAETGDVLILSSLEFETVEYEVTQEDLDSGNAAIPLTSKVNELEEVFLFEHQLSGNIKKDLGQIPTYEENLPLWNAQEIKEMRLTFKEDAQSPIENSLIPEAQSLKGINLAPLITATHKLITKKRRKKQDHSKYIKDFLSEKLIIEELNLPDSTYYFFKDFLLEQPATANIVLSKDPLKIMEYIRQQYEVFSRN